MEVLCHLRSAALGGVRSIDWTEVCNRLIPWATWSWQRIYGLATITSAMKGSSAYLAIVQTISRPCLIESDSRHCQRWAGTIICTTLASSLTFRTTKIRSLCAKGCLVARFQLKVDSYNSSCWNAGSAVNHSIHTVQARRGVGGWMNPPPLHGNCGPPESCIVALYTAIVTRHPVSKIGHDTAAATRQPVPSSCRIEDHASMQSSTEEKFAWHSTFRAISNYL